MVKVLFLWLRLQDKGQVDMMAGFCDIPTDTETPGCPVRVTVAIIIGAHVVVAVLDGQDIGPAVGLDVTGEKTYWIWMPLFIIRDRGALPPPLRFVVAPHFQSGSCHLHACSRRGER